MNISSRTAFFFLALLIGAACPSQAAVPLRAAPPVGAVPPERNTFPFRTLPEVFSTSKQTIMSACAGGFVIGDVPHTTEAQLEAFDASALKFLKGRALFDSRTSSGGVITPAGLSDPFVIVESPAATALKLCISGKISPASFPAGFNEKLVTRVYLGGEIKSMNGVKTWTVQVALLGERGERLGLFLPTDSSRGVTDPAATGSRWEQLCSEPRCAWLGMNSYDFNLGTVPKEAQTLRLIFTRGAQTEMRDYNAQTFDRSQLADLR